MVEVDSKGSLSDISISFFFIFNFTVFFLVCFFKIVVLTFYIFFYLNLLIPVFLLLYFFNQIVCISNKIFFRQSTSNRITSGANAINVPMNGLNRNVQVVLSVPMMNTPFLNPTSNFFTSNQGFTSFPLTGLQNPVLQNPTSPFGINSFTSPVIPLNGGVNAFNGFRVQ
ncbi:hypothetical protein HMI54_008498 [Coelomomyces lativittatus]|nr:hypothetical protein HMI56_003469 [Coelomomyces lativittatus]KAJ1502999.1 hypothetical protein HMI54_008498 [Coelomomyces lativittatus]